MHRCFATQQFPPHCVILRLEKACRESAEHLDPRVKKFLAPDLIRGKNF